MRISWTLASVLREDKDQAWFYVDEVEKRNVKGRCAHDDTIAIAEGSTDEYCVERPVVELSKFGVQLAAS